jgi:hypothetical protein
VYRMMFYVSCFLWLFLTAEFYLITGTSRRDKFLKLTFLLNRVVYQRAFKDMRNVYMLPAGIINILILEYETLLSEKGCHILK